jgi:hypothetical protein
VPWAVTKGGAGAWRQALAITPTVIMGEFGDAQQNLWSLLPGSPNSAHTQEREMILREKPVARLGLIAGLAALALAGTAAAQARKTLTVCPTGPPKCQFDTIQAALDAAEDGDRILIAPGSYDGGFTIADSVSLIGSGADQTTIRRGEPPVDEVPVVSVPPAVSATVSRVTITGGVWSYTPGSAIHNEGRLTVDASSVSGNTAFGSRGVPIYSNGTLLLTGSIVGGNHTNDTGGINNDGGTLSLADSVVSNNDGFFTGGIINEGTATITDTTIAFNRNFGYEGNGIFNGGSLSLTRSAVDDNGLGAGAGGGIFNIGEATLTETTVNRNRADEGGGIVNNGMLTLRRSSVNDNACCAGALGEDGGGIENFGTALLIHSEVNGNNTFQGNGGGIYNHNLGSLTLISTDVEGNVANQFLPYGIGSGGGIYNAGHADIFRAVIAQNVAAGQGGGIANGGGTLTLDHSRVTGNTAQGLDGSGIFGGGIYNIGALGLTQTAVTGNIPDDCVGC